MELIKVGMADLDVVKDSGVLVTLGLGSCVGIALYDRHNRVAGLAHAMLPSSKEISNNNNKAKFVDTGIGLLIERMIQEGALRNNLTAKIAGGSQMFVFNINNNILKIGQRNILATKKELSRLGIRIISEDVGGNYGRTIEFSARNGSLLIKTIGHGVRTI